MAEAGRFVYKLGRLIILSVKKVFGLFAYFSKLLQKSLKYFQTRTQNATPSFQTRLTPMANMTLQGAGQQGFP